MTKKHLPRCSVCGTIGHASGKHCPVNDLNKLQEDNAKLGLTPSLEAEIQRIRSKWREEHTTQPVIELSQMQPSQVQTSPGFAFSAVRQLQSHWKKTAFVFMLCLLCIVQRASAGNITGQFQTATGGVIGNGTLTFHLSQPMVIAGSGQVITQDSNCYTSTAGNIVGLPDPLVLPVTSANLVSGTLPAGTYYVVLTYFGASGETLASSETTQILSAQGTLNVNAPALQPASATGYNVYIGTSSGTEKLQGAITGWGQFQQTSTLVGSTALPGTNSTVCSIHFSDEGIPTGTYYSVNLVNKNGSKISGFPQTWCTYGGANGTINVSNGAPVGSCGFNGVFYPTPIFTTPANNSLQSISGPLTIVGKATFPSTNNNVVYADTFSGADASIKVNAAITSIIAIGGGTVDARGLGGVQTISQQINVGNHNQTPVTLLLPSSATWQVAITDGVSSAIRQYGNTQIIGPQLGPGGMQITPLSSSTSVVNYYQTESAPLGGGSYIRAGGFMIYNPTVATTGGVGMELIDLFDNSRFENITVADYKSGKGMVIIGACCSTNLINVTVNSDSRTGQIPVQILSDNLRSTEGVNWFGGSIDHPGTSNPNLLIQALNGSSLSTVRFFGTFFEGSNADAATPFVILNGTGSQIDAGFFGVTTYALTAASTQPAISVQTTGSSGVVVSDVQMSGSVSAFPSVAVDDQPNSIQGLTDTHGRFGTFANTPSSVANILQFGTVTRKEMSAPSSPAVGYGALWNDSTDHRLHDKNPSGTVGTTVVADTGASNNFLTGISAAGVISKAQPSASSLSDYTTGTWTPVATNLSNTGGAPTITGNYTQIGKLVFFTIIITPVTNTSSTANSTSFTLPSSPARNTVCIATDNNVDNLGTGQVATSGSVFPPTWTTKAVPVQISGSYQLP